MSGTNYLKFATRLFFGKLIARGANHLLYDVRLKELKAIAKSTLLANHGIDRNWAEGKSEVQLYKFAQRNFNSQQG